MVTGRERDVESALEEGDEDPLAVVGVQRMLAERRDGDSHLCEVVEVLERKAVLEVATVRDAVGQQEGRRQVVDRSSRARVRPSSAQKKITVNNKDRTYDRTHTHTWGGEGT